MISNRAIAIATMLALSVFAPQARGGEVAWRTWDAGMAEAASSGRPVVVNVYTGWCGWCKRMDRDVYARDDVRNYLARNFVAIRLDAESRDPAKYENRNYTSSALAQRFHVSGYPTTIFLRSNGEHVVNVPGYIEPERFKLMLRFFGEGHFDRGVRWQDFEKNGGAAEAPQDR